MNYVRYGGGGGGGGGLRNSYFILTSLQGMGE